MTLPPLTDPRLQIIRPPRGTLQLLLQQRRGTQISTLPAVVVAPIPPADHVVAARTVARVLVLQAAVAELVRGRGVF